MRKGPECRLIDADEASHSRSDEHVGSEKTQCGKIADVRKGADAALLAFSLQARISYSRQHSQPDRPLRYRHEQFASRDKRMTGFCGTTNFRLDQRPQIHCAVDNRPEIRAVHAYDIGSPAALICVQAIGTKAAVANK